MDIKIEKHLKLEVSVINLLFELEERTVDDIFNELIKIIDLNNQSNMWLLSRNLYHVCYGRPHIIIQLCNIASLVKEYVKDKDEWCAALSISILSKTGDFFSFAPLESVFMYGFLSMFNVIDPTKRLKATYEKIKTNTSMLSEMSMSVFLPLVLTCYDILTTNIPDFFNDLKKFIQKKYPSLIAELENFKISNQKVTDITPFKLNLNDGTFKSTLSKSHLIHLILSSDNIDALQDLSLDPGFDFDQRVEPTLVCGSELLANYPTIISLSAFYGAVKCFKFLFINNAHLDINDLSEIPNSIAVFAAVGGNIEIIRLLLTNHIDLSETVFYSIAYHKNRLFFWFLEQNANILENISNDGLSMMHFAAMSNNIEVAQICAEKQVKFDFTNDYDNDDIESPLDLACSYDCSSIVYILCKYYKNIPKKSLFSGLSNCISSNSSEAFSVLIQYSIDYLRKQDINDLIDLYNDANGQIEGKGLIPKLLKEYSEKIDL